MFEHIDIKVNGMNEAQLKNEITKKLAVKNKTLITEVRFVGKSEIEINVEDIQRSFESYRYYIIIKNSSTLALQFEPIKNENSLRSMFINKILNDDSLDDDTKEKVISYGLSKLMKEEG